MRIAALLGLMALTAFAGAAAAPEPWERDVLDLHNRERAAFGSQPLLWDERLAGEAASYAAELAALGRLVHAPKQRRRGQGENLAMGSRGYYGPTALAGTWSAERRFFRRGIFPDNSVTGNWMAVGHYTQMVWPGSTHLGCGFARGRRIDVLVCRYAPAGNRDGIAL
jgi:uncharacterized protein YkwD